MRRRWELSYDGGATWSEVEPENGAEITFTDKRDLSKGQIFYRRTIGGGVLFGGQEFLDLKSLLEDPAARCNSLFIRLSNKCEEGWDEFWRGEFSPAGGEWNFDECSVEVEPTTVDKYTCLLDAQDEKRNILQAEVVTATAMNLPSLQMIVCPSIGFVVVGCEGVFDGVSLYNEWTSAHGQVGPLYQINVFWRERLTTECVGGDPVMPSGAGWVLEANNCAVDGTATYIRETTIPWTFGDVVAGNNTDGVYTPPDDTCDWVFISAVDESYFDPFDPNLGFVPYYVCLSSGSSVTLSRARTLHSAVEHLVEQTGCELAGVRSDLFEWDPPGDAAGYAPGINYVTGLANQINALLILHKSDAKFPTASNPATIGEMTFGEAMNMLFVMFRVLWDIDDDGYVRIEHWRYWTSVQGLDLTTMDDVIEPLAFSYPRASVPRIERATFMEAQGRDFVGRDIIYRGPCAGDTTKEWTPGKVSTDISMILSDPTEIDSSGFVLLATMNIGSSFSTIIDQGAITGNQITNAPLSWANLQRDLWTWDRYLPEGEMNGAQTTFDGFLPNIEQSEVSISMCCGPFDPADYLTTHLGESLGSINAYVEQAEHNLLLDTTTFTLRYAY